MGEMRFGSKERDGEAFFRTVNAYVKHRISVSVGGVGVSPVDVKDATSVICMADTDDTLSVYFRGDFMPHNCLVTGTPLDWIWNLAYHLTVIRRQLDGKGQEEVTMDDVAHTIMMALMLPKIQESSDED